MLNGLVELSLRYKFLVLIVFAVVAFLGLRAVREVPIDAFPDVTPALVNIYTESPGLAAEDVELLLTTPVESALAGLPKVQEIRSYEQPTRIANAPAFVKGVVNLRGVIVPIVDLRLKLACESAEYNDFTVVIVLNVKGRVVGAVVDSVSDVLELAAGTIKPAPEMNSAVDTSFITGIGSIQDRMLILMDIEALMSSADMGLV